MKDYLCMKHCHIVPLWLMCMTVFFPFTYVVACIIWHIFTPGLYFLVILNTFFCVVRVLIGTGRVCIETLRPLAYTLLAELVHYVREDISLPQVKLASYIDFDSSILLIDSWWCPVSWICMYICHYCFPIWGFLFWLDTSLNLDKAKLLPNFFIAETIETVLLLRRVLGIWCVS